MTPKQKAQELFNKYYLLDIEIDLNHPDPESTTVRGYKDSKQCALIAVDEILQTLFDNFHTEYPGVSNYWQEVKEEIIKL